MGVWNKAFSPGPTYLQELFTLQRHYQYWSIEKRQSHNNMSSVSKTEFTKNSYAKKHKPLSAGLNHNHLQK